MSGYVCLMCDGEYGEVVEIATSLENGKTVASCRNCLPVSLIGALSVELGVDAAKLYDNVSKFVARQQKAAEAAAAAPEPGAGPDGQYEDGNTEYGQLEADDLQERLAAEAAAET